MLHEYSKYMEQLSANQCCHPTKQDVDFCNVFNQLLPFLLEKEDADSHQFLPTHLRYSNFHSALMQIYLGVHVEHSNINGHLKTKNMYI